MFVQPAICSPENGMDGKQLTGVNPGRDHPSQFWGVVRCLGFPNPGIVCDWCHCPRLVGDAERIILPHREKRTPRGSVGFVSGKFAGMRSMKLTRDPSIPANMKATATVTSPQGCCLRSCGTLAWVVAWAGEPRQRLLFTLGHLQPDIGHPGPCQTFHQDHNFRLLYKSAPGWPGVGTMHAWDDGTVTQHPLGFVALSPRRLDMEASNQPQFAAPRKPL